MASSLQLQRVLLLVLVLSPVAQAWVTVTSSVSRSHSHSLAGIDRSASASASASALVVSKARRPSRLVLSAQDSDNDSQDSDSQEADDRTTSFAKADQSLMDEADKKRMDEMGDFDLNSDYEQTNIEQMREAVRARTSAMGLEKSKVSADYIQSKTTQAKQGGPGQTDPDSFGGLDLSQISDKAPAGERKSTYDETLPSMFYDPEDDLTKEEQMEVDPISKENPFKQGLNELSNAKWPGLTAALREVVVLVIVVAVTGFIIIEWDQLLRTVYTTAGFIPNSDSLAKYAARFDGLDLPAGWTNNMSDSDVSNMAEQVNTPGGAAAAAVGSSLPSL